MVSGDLHVDHPLNSPLGDYPCYMARAAGVDVVCWDVPSHTSIYKGTYVLVTGEVVKEAEHASKSKA